MKIWVDDIRTPPKDYIWCKSVNETITYLKTNKVNEIDLDHDLGVFAKDGGDAISILDWCVENQIFPNVKIHTANPVGRQNMERIIKRWWKNS